MTEIDTADIYANVPTCGVGSAALIHALARALDAARLRMNVKLEAARTERDAHFPGAPILSAEYMAMQARAEAAEARIDKAMAICAEYAYADAPIPISLLERALTEGVGQ